LPNACLRRSRRTRERLRRTIQSIRSGNSRTSVSSYQVSFQGWRNCLGRCAADVPWG
jgi:hypothetical protein